MMPENRIWNLLARKLANEATEEELLELEQLLYSNPELGYRAEMLERSWNETPGAPAPDERTGKALEQVLARIQEAKQQERHHRKFNHFLNREFMLKNHFTIAFRNIRHHIAYSLINILGLALGVCACIVIYLITSYEFSFDKFHPGQERIFRIVGEMQNSSGEKMFLNSPVPEVAGFQNQIPGFEAACGFHTYGERVTITGDDETIKKFDGRIDGSWSAASIITGPAYFDIFTYQWLAGNSKTSLREPFKVVLSEKSARKYFGNIPLEKMLGKTVVYEDSLKVSVSGIVNDWSGNTDFGFTDFISLSTVRNSFLKDRMLTEDWSSLSPHRSMAFVKLATRATEAQVNARFASFIKKHVKLPDAGSTLTMQLQPLSDIHFTTDAHRADDGDNFRKPYLPTLYSLIGVALFILVIAVVNFINLSTAQSFQRAKETGIRKVLGSNKANLVFQFLAETFVVTSFAVLLSIILVKPVLYLFRDYIPAGISFHLFNISTILFLAAVTLITSLLAGLYPAEFLSSYKPVNSLKGAVFQSRAERINVRKGLIVFQFVISLVFIIAALVTRNQVNFMNTADKGFNTDNIITLNNWGDHEGKLKVFAEQAKEIPGVDKVILQGNAPMGFAQSIDIFKLNEQAGNSQQISAQIGDESFIPFYKMKLIAGRNLLPSDSLNELVINETLSKAMGFTDPHNALGKMLYQQGSATARALPVVGVIADFHQGSFQETIRPAVIENVPERKFSVAIKLGVSEKDLASSKEVLTQLQDKWEKIFPETQFDCSFLNESTGRLYEQEERTAWLMNVATAITIFISCMGLFGLGMFTAQRKTKEIGIRKTLGATVKDITVLLSKDFIKPVIVAILIASPIAWYFMHQWLQDFAYRINISWWIFLVAGLVALFITFLTVSFQAIKAALANPVKSLRTE